MRQAAPHLTASALSVATGAVLSAFALAAFAAEPLETIFDRLAAGGCENITDECTICALHPDREWACSTSRIVCVQTEWKCVQPPSPSAAGPDGRPAGSSKETAQ